MLQLPKDKLDTTSAEKIATSNWVNVRPLMPTLFTWTQDLNWPVAQILYPFFLKHSSEVIENIKLVLQGEDHSWQGFLLDNLIVKMPKEKIRLMEQQLEKLRSTSPDKDVAESAKTLLLRLKGCDK